MHVRPAGSRAPQPAPGVKHPPHMPHPAWLIVTLAVKEKNWTLNLLYAYKKSYILSNVLMRKHSCLQFKRIVTLESLVLVYLLTAALKQRERAPYSLTELLHQLWFENIFACCSNLPSHRETGHATQTKPRHFVKLSETPALSFISEYFCLFCFLWSICSKCPINRPQGWCGQTWGYSRTKVSQFLPDKQANCTTT